MLGGLERKVLATGVQLRVLQRLPQTQAFAVRMSASVDDHGPNTSLAFTAAELAAYSSRRGKTTRSLRAAAEECVSAMASTRDAAAARTEAARRARRAAAIARKLERESAVAEAREELLSGFADRMAELVARHERLRWQRKRRALGERRAEELESRTKRDERMVREELAKELAARRGGEEGVASKEPIVDPKEPILDPKDPIVDTSIASTDGGFERYDSPAARRAALDAGDAGDAGSTPGTGATNYFDDVADESFITAASDSSPVRNLAADLTGVNLDDSAIVDEDAPEEPPAVDEPKAEDTGGTSFEPSTSPATRATVSRFPFPWCCASASRLSSRTATTSCLASSSPRCWTTSAWRRISGLSAGTSFAAPGTSRPRSCRASKRHRARPRRSRRARGRAGWAWLATAGAWAPGNFAPCSTSP